MEMVKFLCEVAKINVNQSNERNETAMMKAIECGHYEIVKYLYQKQDPVAAINGSNDFTPLISAAMVGGMDIFEFLFEKSNKKEEKEGEEILFHFENGVNCLLVAAMFGHFEIVKFICGYEEQPSERKLELIRKTTESNANAYQLALESGHEQTAQYLKPFFENLDDPISCFNSGEKLTLTEKPLQDFLDNFFACVDTIYENQAEEEEEGAGHGDDEEEFSLFS